MQREIKFRVWSPEEKWMEYQGVLSLGSFFDHQVYPLEGKTIQQFTGLTDKNSKEIYEGDILLIPTNDPISTSDNTLVVVEYQGSGFTYRDLKTNQLDVIMGLIGIADKDEEVEVIGNIFENPELLK